MFDKNAKWIWIRPEAEKNEYALFEGSFSFGGTAAAFKIAAETDYILYINGKLASFGQFAGYPFEKYYDEIDITPFCTPGENIFSVTVRYEGVNSATHIDDGPGVIYSLEIDGQAVCCSGSHTPGGFDTRYIQHQERSITGQLGLTSGMKSGEAPVLSPCVEVEKTYNLKPRPVKKTELGEFAEGRPVSAEKHIYDLGRETAGYLQIKVKSPAACNFTVTYGEHLADGEVRNKIGARDFSLDFMSSGGEQEFLQLFVRVAARYLQVDLPEDTEILSIGLLPVLYPLTEKAHAFTGLDKQIYDTCVRTLRLCMNNHYEDCPWREQALYVLDSRNQMLCGYYAFEETEFQRENLVFISKGTRADGYLELTFPAVNTPAIPFFSVMYPVAVYEYVQHTGDTGILKEVMPTLLGIMNNTKDRIEANGLVAEFPAPYWNFYEWSIHNDGDRQLSGTNYFEGKYHLILNCAYVYAAEKFSRLCELAGIEWSADIDGLKAAILREFFNEETGLFCTSNYEKDDYSQLGNAFALLIGLGDERTLESVKNDRSLTPATLSMMIYVYDMLLARDKDSKAYILNDIRQKYGYMLENGATSFWETIEGEAAFAKAGSLCHGWSALPVYYYNILN